MNPNSTDPHTVFIKNPANKVRAGYIIIDETPNSDYGVFTIRDHDGTIILQVTKPVDMQFVRMLANIEVLYAALKEAIETVRQTPAISAMWFMGAYESMLSVIESIEGRDG